MRIEASAPSNIALIKYMGKLDTAQNNPCNSSLSYTLNHLRTFVTLEVHAELKQDKWQALEREDLRPIQLSEKGLTKFLKHFQFLKNQFQISESFLIQSANNFPSDCGLASSASSYAALTVATYQWALKYKNMKPISSEELALLSKKGSGSSCRSLFSPWAIWGHSTVKPVQYPYQNLKHQVILCDENIKSVSSSEAHKQVLTSDLFNGRPERAENRLRQLEVAFENSDWNQAVDICWNEFWDMHVLFHTSKPAFMYMNAGSQSALAQLIELRSKYQESPIVTMDAGSNIHLLYRQDQVELYDLFKSHFNRQFAMWCDEGYLSAN